jgi:hypothetical protein
MLQAVDPEGNLDVHCRLLVLARPHSDRHVMLITLEPRMGTCWPVDAGTPGLPRYRQNFGHLTETEDGRRPRR